MVHRIFPLCLLLLSILFFSPRHAAAVSGAAVSLQILRFSSVASVSVLETVRSRTDSIENMGGSIRHKKARVVVCQCSIRFCVAFHFFILLFYSYFTSHPYFFMQNRMQPSNSTGSLAGPDGQLRQRLAPSALQRTC